MARSLVPPLQRQLARVNRRMLLQALLTTLAWCWFGALLLETIWLLAEPFIPGERPEWVRWAMPAGLIGMGTMLAIGWVLLRAPSRLTMALLLDERFGLQERVTTSLTLEPTVRNTQAAQALLADVNTRIATLDIRSGFPVRLSWPAALVPLGVLLCAGVGFFYEPTRGQANVPPPDPRAEAPANKNEIERKMQELQKTARKKPPAEKLASHKPNPLDEELDKLLNKPRDTKEEVRDRIKEMTALADKMREREQDLAERTRAIKDQLKQINRSTDESTKDGPAKDLRKAIEKGDFNKAQEAMDRLSKKIKNHEMSQEDQEKLQKQLQDLKDKLNKLSRPKEQEEQLKELARQGKIDQDTLERELKKLKENSEALTREDQQNMQDLADQLEKCKQCLRQGDAEGAAENLRQAGKKLRQMGDEEQREEMAEQLERLEEARQCMCRGMGNKPGPGGLGIGSGRRPDGDPHVTRSTDSKVRGHFDPRGQKELTGYAQGHSFKKKSSKEIAGDIQQASQAAPEAIERQRIPRAASDMAKGYFENFRKVAGDEGSNTPQENKPSKP